MASTWSLTGVKEMRDRLKKLAANYPKRVAQAVYIEASIIMTESKRRCPVAPDGGTLRASGIVHLPEIGTTRTGPSGEFHAGDGSNISVTMSYGGAAQAYALAVHEHLSEHSPWTWVIAELSGRGINWNADGTGPKFLEGPINEALPHIGYRIAKRIALK